MTINPNMLHSGEKLNTVPDTAILELDIRLLPGHTRLLSDKVPLAEFLSRFHGNNERIDVDSLRLTTKLFLDVFDRLWR